MEFRAWIGASTCAVASTLSTGREQVFLNKPQDNYLYFVTEHNLIKANQSEHTLESEKYDK